MISESDIKTKAVGVTRDVPLTPRDGGSVFIIVPVFNEEASIGPFLSAMSKALATISPAYDFSIVFVNDGSRDKTLDVIKVAASEDRRISVLNLARNFGKEAAMCAGLDCAVARDASAAIVMDVDLQDPPALISKFIDHWSEGYDVVLGERSDRKTDGWVKRETAKRFYNTFNRLSQTKIPHNVGDFRLMDKRVIASIAELRERNRFMKGLFAWVGYSTISVPFERDVRAAGDSKFKFMGLWRFAMDGIFGFSNLPLKLSTYLSALVAFGAIIYALFLIIRTMILGVDVPGYASLMVVLLFVSSFQFFTLGIIGEYLARLTTESKQRPIYIVEGHYRLAEKSKPKSNLKS